jgi:hypothetical protein
MLSNRWDERRAEAERRVTQPTALDQAYSCALVDAYMSRKDIICEATTSM